MFPFSIDGHIYYRACAGILYVPEWSYIYVTASPSHKDLSIPILSPVLFKHVGHPYIPFLPFFKIEWIYLSPPPFLMKVMTDRMLSTHVYTFPLLLYFPCPHKLYCMHTEIVYY